ncbi:MAG: ATP12 family protein [Acetobacteraceae bacterium]|nr:ATP12 family protein [Acetobacteraceae bacterium]
MKRFWNSAEAVAQDDHWTVELDGKPVRLPGGGALAVPSAHLARALAAEWQAAGGEFTYDDLPFTRLAGTAQERVVVAREAVIEELARYGESDLLCYRAEIPVSLVEAQAQLWQPWIDWAARELGSELVVTQGIVHVAQPPAALAALTQAVAMLDEWRLAALGVLVPALGSLVLGLAVVRGALAASEAHEIATLDERHQAAFWGWDAEAQTRLMRVGADLAMAGRFLDACAE